MKKSHDQLEKDQTQQMAAMAVLAASAREAEELLASDPDLARPCIEEAHRRLKLFMRAGRESDT